MIFHRILAACIGLLHVRTACLAGWHLCPAPHLLLFAPLLLLVEALSVAATTST